MVSTTPIERLRKLHQLWDMPEKPNVRTCTECAEPWPCDTVAALDGLEAENARLREQAKGLTEALGGLLSSVRNQPWDVGIWCGNADAALRAYREANHG